MTWFGTPRLAIGRHGQFPFRRRFFLSQKEYHQHAHVIGSTGSGKSRALAGMYLELVRLGHAVTLIDPHGSTAALILRHLIAQGVYHNPASFERILYLDVPKALSRNRYLPYNILAQHRVSDIVASNIKEAFHRAWTELAVGAATFDVLLPDCVELLIHNRLPLTEIHRILVDDHFRQALLDRESDPYLVSSFQDVYEKLRGYDQVTYAGSVLRRARQLTQLQVLRHSLGQEEFTLDFAKILAQNQSLIINLALPSEDAKRLIGCLLTVNAEQSAKGRADIQGGHYRPHFLLIDEAQLFLAQSGAALVSMLSETRKFKLFLWMSHQDWQQLPDSVRGAMANVGFELTFNLDRFDAEYSGRRIGSVDSERVKHVVSDEQAVERTHPLYHGLPEQWEGITQTIQDLRLAQALVWVKSPSRKWFGVIPAPVRRVAKVKLMHVPDVEVNPNELARVEEQYLSRYFRPAPVGSWHEVTPETRESLRKTLAN